MKRLNIIFLFCIFLILLITKIISATTISVPDDYTSIQTAINAAQDGYKILVQPGIYYENINLNGKNIVLTSLFLATGNHEYISQTVINGNHNGSVVTFENEEDNNCKLIGFVIKNGKGIYSNNNYTGGGITCINNSYPILQNLIITENSAIKGGGVYLNASIKIIESNIFNNTTENGINASTDGQHGSSAGDGGGIYIENGEITIENSTLQNNKTGKGGSGGGTGNGLAGKGAKGGDGACICLNNGTLTLDDSIISNNEAGNGGAGGTARNSYGKGGVGGSGGNAAGIYINNGQLFVNSSVIRENTTGYGGNGGNALNAGGGSGGIGGNGSAIFIINGTAVINNSDISQNVNMNGGKGGSSKNAKGAKGGKGGSASIYIQDGDLTILNTLILKNISGRGGNGGTGYNYYGIGGDGGDGGDAGIVLENDGTNIKIINSIISGNVHGTGGTRAYYYSDKGVNGNVGNGGGILGGTGEIINCTIVSNTPNGIENFNGNTINSIIYFNTSAQIEGMITITYSNIEGSYTGNNIIDSDPLFVDISKDDFHLLNNSPCINAGSNITLNDSNSDKDGNFRLSIFDIGAYENISVQSNYYKSVNFQHIAAGYFHSLALKEDGTLWSWGYNGNGELGNGNDLEQQNPVKVKNLNNIINMVAGHHHNLALKNDGSVWAWGKNEFGELGNGSTTTSHIPIQVANLTDVKGMAIGHNHSLALKNDGTVWAWGRNNYGQLGESNTSDQYNTPVQISGLNNVKQIDAGYYHTIALKNDGTIVAFGYNVSGQLGDGSLTNVVSIAAGENHNLALKKDGTVWGWGSNNCGNLGDEVLNFSSTPVLISNLTNIKAIIVGNAHDFAIKDDGAIWTWGRNDYGESGTGGNIDKTIPVQIQGLNNVKTLAAGDYHSIALKDDGSIWAWGHNEYNQLGYNTLCIINKPRQISVIKNITKLATGYSHCLGLSEDGNVWSWGSNDFGQLGIHTLSNKSIPVNLSDLTNVIDLAAGSKHSLALKKDGSVWTWGWNSYGQLGDGTTTDKNYPIKIPDFDNVIKLCAADQQSFAIKNDGTIWAWGYNGYGQLGIGTDNNSSHPTKIANLTNIIELVANDSHTIALNDDGTIWAWGSNFFGQLGDNTIDKYGSHNIPVLISGISNIKQIIAGQRYSMALKKDGTIWAWGDNDYGQLGDGTTIDKNTPVQISNVDNIIQLGAEKYKSLGLKSDGTVWVVNVNPEQVSGIFNVKALVSGPLYSLAIKKDGTVWGWGYNRAGQLGNGYPTYIPEPCTSDIQFKSKTYVTSQQGTINIPVIKKYENENITINYSSIDGTGVSNIDYIAVSDSLNFNINEIEKQIPITILDNNSRNSDRSIFLSINTSNDNFINNAFCILTIPTDQLIEAPYIQEFSYIMPGTGWTYYSSSENGRIQVIADRLRMDTFQEDIYNLNEAILTIDLSQSINISIEFFQKNLDAENTPLPEYFEGHYNGDGLSMSNDGNIWYRIVENEALYTDNLGKNYNIMLDSIVENIKTSFDSSFDYSKNFMFKFQQHGYRSYPGDGREWDNIKINASIRENQAPLVNSQNVSTSLNHDLEITLTASDSDSITLNYFIARQPQHGTLTGNPPEIIYTPNLNYSGADYFEYKANDGESDSEIARINIQILDIISVFPESYTVSAYSGTSYFTVVNSENTNWTVSTTDNWLQIIEQTTNGFVIEYIENNGEQRTGSITITSPDAANSPQIIKIYQKAYQPLIISDIDDQTTNEDIPITINFSIENILSDSENIAISIVSLNQEIVQDNKIILIRNAKDYSIIITPAENAYGTATIKINLSYNSSITYRIFMLNVQPVNDKPVFTSTSIPIMYEDDGEKMILWANYVSPGPENESSQKCTFSINPSSHELFSKNPIIKPNGILSFTAAPDAYGTAVFEVMLMDDGGTENNGIDKSSIQKFTIVINPVNDCPDFVIGEDKIIYNRDGTQNIPFWASNINTGINENEQTLQFFLSTSDDSLFETLPSVLSNGALTFSPNPDKTGSAIISVYAKDSGGTEYSGCDISNTQQFTITVLQSSYELTIRQEGHGQILLNNEFVLPELKKSFNADEIVIVKAIPDSNWDFEHWYGDISDSSRELSITLNRPITITAKFYEPPVTLNLVGKNQVKINGTNYNLPWSKQFKKHSNVIIEPVQPTEFLRWSGDINHSNYPVNISLEKNTTIGVHFKDPYEWSAVIHAEADDLGGTFQDDITVGVSIMEDTESDILANNFSCSMLIYSNNMNKLSKDIRLENTLNIYKWIIAINPHGNVPPLEDRTAKISWNPSQFSPTGFYRLIKGYGEQEKEVVISDMRTTTEFYVTGGNSEQYLTLIWSDKDLFEFLLLSGWNLISLPLIPDDPGVEALFPGINVVYEFKSGSYVTADVIKPGKGYFIEALHDKKYVITGKPFSSNYIPKLNQGWHLLGALNNKTIPETIPSNSIEVIYQFLNGSYTQVDEFCQGKGYWVKIIKKADFILNGN